MPFKIKAWLSSKQLFRVKFISCVTTAVTLIGLAVQYYAETVEARDEITWPLDDDPERENYENNKWSAVGVTPFPRGRIVHLSKNSAVCDSWVLFPGISILPRGLTAPFYFMALNYLFMGIGVVSDIFMESIEKITATTQVITVESVDEQGQSSKEQKKVLVWNATVANLTLMALGSSAPEILLAVIETASNLGGCPGELGASTIVGSAAFNLLVISAASIWAVSPETDTDDDRDTEVPQGIKRVYDLGVFGVTATFSVFAYVWMWVVLLDQKVQIWEAWLTFGFTWILLAIAYGADRYKAANEPEEDGMELAAIPYSAFEIHQELMNDLQTANKQLSEEETKKRAEMKDFLKKSFGTDKIEQINYEELKKKVEGNSLVTRLKYRKGVTSNITGKTRIQVSKGEKLRLEHAHADKLADSEVNESYGFRCLQYSVSEACGNLEVTVINKKRTAGSVRICTVEGEAKSATANAKGDYDAVDQVVQFAVGQASQKVSIVIHDDEEWNPNRDFTVHLYATGTKDELDGRDTKCKVMIIDDDQPGYIGFSETKNTIKALASDTHAEIVLLRKNGTDGKVTVKYCTVELDQSDAHAAKAGSEYTHVEDVAVFEAGETQFTIRVPILTPSGKEDASRDEQFGIQLSDIHPAGAKLSKKDFQRVNIITDVGKKKREEMYRDAMQKMQDEEEITWGRQFIIACELYPKKDEEGELQEVEGMDAFWHFVLIGWKVFYSLIPPPHYGGGLPCFGVALAFIGITTAIVGEFAELFGCVIGLKPTVTAITFVALGTSLPDTFASMTAAQSEKYADAAIGNVTGSNSVNVFLGLGLPWIIGSMFEARNSNNPDGGYFVPAGALGFSVVVFLICACTCLVILVIRRVVVGGELGGTEKSGRLASAVVLVSLWFLYIIMSSLQAYDMIPMPDHYFGIDVNTQHYDPKCKY